MQLVMVHLLQYWNLWCCLAWRNKLARAPLKGSIHKCSYQKGSNLYNRKGSVPKSCWVCFDPWILPEHLPPSWQSPEGRPETLKHPKFQEVGSWNRRKKEDDRCLLYKKFRFFHPTNLWKTFFEYSVWAQLEAIFIFSGVIGFSGDS